MARTKKKLQDAQRLELERRLYSRGRGGRGRGRGRGRWHMGPVSSNFMEASTQMNSITVGKVDPIPCCSQSVSPVLSSGQHSSNSSLLVPFSSGLEYSDVAKDSAEHPSATSIVASMMACGKAQYDFENTPVERRSSPRNLSPASSGRCQVDQPEQLESPVNTRPALGASNQTARKSTSGGKRKRLLYELIGVDGIVPIESEMTSGEVTPSGRSTPQEGSTPYLAGSRDRGNIFDKLLTGLTDESSLSESEIGEKNLTGATPKKKPSIVVFNTVGQAVQNMGLKCGKVPLVCMKDVLKAERNRLYASSASSNSMHGNKLGDLKKSAAQQSNDNQKHESSLHNEVENVSRQEVCHVTTSSSATGSRSPSVSDEKPCQGSGISKTFQAQAKTAGMVSSLVSNEKFSTATLMSSRTSSLENASARSPEKMPSGLLPTSFTLSEKRKRSPNVRLGSDMILLPWHTTRRPRDKTSDPNSASLGVKGHSSGSNPRKSSSSVAGSPRRVGYLTKAGNYSENNNQSSSKATPETKQELGPVKGGGKSDVTILPKSHNDKPEKDTASCEKVITKPKSVSCAEKSDSCTSVKDIVLPLGHPCQAEQLQCKIKTDNYVQGQTMEGQNAMFRTSPTASPRKCKIVAVIKSPGFPSIKNQRLISPPSVVLSPSKVPDNTISPTSNAKRKIVFLLGKDALSFEHDGSGDGPDNAENQEKSQETDPVKPMGSVVDKKSTPDITQSDTKTVQPKPSESLGISCEQSLGKTTVKGLAEETNQLCQENEDIDFKSAPPPIESTVKEDLLGSAIACIEKAKHHGLSHLISRMSERVTHSLSTLDAFSEVLGPVPVQGSGESTPEDISPISSPLKTSGFSPAIASTSTLNIDGSDKGDANLSNVPSSTGSKMSLDDVTGESSCCIISLSSSGTSIIEQRPKLDKLMCDILSEKTGEFEPILPEEALLQHSFSENTETCAPQNVLGSMNSSVRSSPVKSSELLSVPEKAESQNENRDCLQAEQCSAKDALDENVQETAAENIPAICSTTAGVGADAIESDIERSELDGKEDNSTKTNLEGLRYGQRTREPAPLSVFAAVEKAIPEKVLSAFMSEDLDSYLQSNENRAIKLAPKSEIKKEMSPKIELKDGIKMDKIRRRRRKLVKEELSSEAQEENSPCPMQFSINPSQPDFDDIDGLLFVSFPSKESMAAHIRIERQRHWDDNNFHFLDMSKLQALDRLRKKYGVTSKFKLPKYMRHKELNFRGIHMKWRKYARLYEREMDKVAKAQQIRAEGMPSNVSKVLEKTNDITKIKGWKKKYFEQSEKSEQSESTENTEPLGELSLQHSGKLHWRTEQRLLKSLKPEDIKEMGLALKKKRRKNMIFTHRKGSAKMEGKVGRSGRLSRPVASQEDDYYYGDEDQYYKDVLEEEDTACSKIPFKKMSLKKKLMKKYNLCGLKKLKKLWKRRLREGLNAAEEKDQKEQVPSDEVDDPQLLTQSMVMEAVAALDFDILGVNSPRKSRRMKKTPDKALADDSKKKMRTKKDGPDKVTNSRSQKLKRKKDSTEPCDKPGCRYGCVCHLFRDRAVPGSKGSDSEESPQESLNQPCDKEYCRLGCICSSLDRHSKEKKSAEHCGKIECMLQCHCVAGSVGGSAGNRMNLSGMSSSGSDDIPTLLAETSLPVAPRSNEHSLSPDACVLAPPLPAVQMVQLEESSPIKKSTLIRKGYLEKYANLPRRVGSQRVAKNLDAVTRKALLNMDPDDLFPRPKRRGKRKMSLDLELSQTVFEEKVMKTSSHSSLVKIVAKPSKLGPTVASKIPYGVAVKGRDTVFVKKVRTLSVDVGLVEGSWDNDDSNDKNDDVDSPDFDYDSCARTSAFNPVRRPVNEANQKMKGLPENMEVSQPEVYLDCFDEDLQESTEESSGKNSMTTAVSPLTSKSSSQDRPEIECLTPMIRKDDKKRKRKQRLEKMRSEFLDTSQDKKKVKNSETKGSKAEIKESNEYETQGSETKATTSADVILVAQTTMPERGPKVHPYWLTHMVCLKPIQKSKPTSQQTDLPKCDQHLLDIKSNCDWEKKRNPILSRISQCLTPSVYPTPQQLIVEDFTVEILPKSGKPACIPPNLQCQLPATMFSIKVKVTPTWYEAKVSRNYELKKEAIAKKAAKKEMTASEHLRLRKQKLAAADVSLSLNLPTKSNDPTTTSSLQTVAADLDEAPPVSSSDSSSWMRTTGISGLSRLQINKSVSIRASRRASDPCDPSSMEKFRLREGTVQYNSGDGDRALRRHSSKPIETVDLVGDEDKPQTFIDLTESDDPQNVDSPKTLTSKVTQAVSIENNTIEEVGQGVFVTSNNLSMVSSKGTPVPVDITRNLASDITKSSVSMLPPIPSSQDKPPEQLTSKAAPLPAHTSQGEVSRQSASQVSPVLQAMCKMPSASSSTTCTSESLPSQTTVQSQSVTVSSKSLTVSGRMGNVMKSGPVTLCIDNSMGVTTTMRSVPNSLPSVSSTVSLGTSSSSVPLVSVLREGQPTRFATSNNLPTIVHSATPLPGSAMAIRLFGPSVCPGVLTTPTATKMMDLPRMQLVRGSDGHYPKLVPLTPGKIGNMSLVQLVPLQSPAPGRSLLSGKATGKATDLVAFPVVIHPVSTKTDASQQSKSVPPTHKVSKLPGEVGTLTNASRLVSSTIPCLIPQPGPRLMPVNLGTAQPGATVLLKPITPALPLGKIITDITASAVLEKGKEQMKQTKSQEGSKNMDLCSSSSVSSDCNVAGTSIMDVTRKENVEDQDGHLNISACDQSEILQAVDSIPLTGETKDDDDDDDDAKISRCFSAQTSPKLPSVSLEESIKSDVNVHNSNANEERRPADKYLKLSDCDVPKQDLVSLPDKELPKIPRTETSREVGQFPAENCNEILETVPKKEEAVILTECMAADADLNKCSLKTDPVTSTDSGISTAVDGPWEEIARGCDMLTDISVHSELPSKESASDVAVISSPVDTADAMESTPGCENSTRDTDATPDVTADIMDSVDSTSISDPVKTEPITAYPSDNKDTILNQSTNLIDSSTCSQDNLISDIDRNLAISSKEDTPVVENSLKMSSNKATSDPLVTLEQSETMPLPEVDIMPDHFYPVSVVTDPVIEPSGEDGGMDVTDPVIEPSGKDGEPSGEDGGMDMTDPVIELDHISDMEVIDNEIPGTAGQYKLKCLFAGREGEVEDREPVAKAACPGEPFSGPASGTQTPDCVSVGADSQNSLDSWSDQSENVELLNSGSQSATNDESDVDIEGFSDDNFELSSMGVASDSRVESSRNKRKSPVQSKQSTAMDIQFTEELLLVGPTVSRTAVNQKIHKSRERERRSVMRQSFSHLTKLVFAEVEQKSVICKQATLTRALKCISNEDARNAILKTSLERERLRNNSLQQHLRLLSADRSGDLYQTLSTCLQQPGCMSMLGGTPQQQQRHHVVIQQVVPEYIPVPGQVQTVQTGNLVKEVSKTDPVKNAEEKSEVVELSDTEVNNVEEVSDTEEVESVVESNDTEEVNHVEEVSDTEEVNHVEEVSDTEEVNSVEELSDTDEVNLAKEASVKDKVNVTENNIMRGADKMTNVTPMEEVNNGNTKEDAERLNNGDEEKLQGGSRPHVLINTLHENVDPSLVESLTLGDGSSIKIMFSDDSCVLVESDGKGNQEDIQVCKVSKSPQKIVSALTKTNLSNPVTPQSILNHPKTRTLDKTNHISSPVSIVLGDIDTDLPKSSELNILPSYLSPSLGVQEEGPAPIIDIVEEESGFVVVQPGSTLVIHTSAMNQDNRLRIGNVCSLTNLSS